MNLRSILTLCFAFAGVACLLFGCSGGASNTPNAPAAGNRGPEIVGEYLKRDASPYRKSRIKFTVTEEGEQPKVYEVESTRKQAGDETTTLNEIVAAPPGEEGGRSLSIERKGQKTVIVTYAAARDEFRETDSKKIFFGLTAGELLGDWDKFDHRFVGEKDLNGVKVFEVESKLKESADSAVSRMTTLFREDNYVPAESHLFGADGKEIRTYKTATIKDDPVHPYASRVEVDNPVYKAHIVIEILNREYPDKIDDATFARDKLKEAAKK